MKEVESRILHMAHRTIKKKGQLLPLLTLIRIKNRFNELCKKEKHLCDLRSEETNYDDNLSCKIRHVKNSYKNGELLMLSEILEDSMSILYGRQPRG